MVAEKMFCFFFYKNIQCDLSNERKLHQGFKYAIKIFFSTCPVNSVCKIGFKIVEFAIFFKKCQMKYFEMIES